MAVSFYNTNQWIAQRGLDFAAIKRILGCNLHQIAYLDQKIHQILEYLNKKSIMSPSSLEEEATSLPEVEEHSSSRLISPTATTPEVNHLGKVTLDHRIIKLVDVCTVM